MFCYDSGQQLLLVSFTIKLLVIQISTVSIILSVCVPDAGPGTTPSSEDSSSGWENSDSAVESSDDDEEMVEVMKQGENDSDTSDSDNEGASKDFLGLFGPDGKFYLFL